MLLKRLYKIKLLVRFGTLWYGKWYGARLGVPPVPHSYRSGTVVRLAKWYALRGSRYALG